MPSLKTLRVRIKSVKSTQKITKAMKMVAAAKLRRAKERAEAARPYAERMEQVLSSVAGSGGQVEAGRSLLLGSGQDKTHLLIVATSDRGLCGAFNGSIVRATKRRIAELTVSGHEVKLLCVGRKGAEQLVAEHKHRIVERFTEIGKRGVTFEEAETIAKRAIEFFETGVCDRVSIVYNHFKSAISQVVTWQQLVPLEVASCKLQVTNESPATCNVQLATPYEYEPTEEELLAGLLPRNVAVQIYKALLENLASEQGARMTAMDNATRNAGEMIKKLTLSYNRSRQATITKELIEIISGAEAI